jgi:hypothetical protein
MIYNAEAFYIIYQYINNSGNTNQLFYILDDIILFILYDFDNII